MRKHHPFPTLVVSRVGHARPELEGRAIGRAGARGVAEGPLGRRAAEERRGPRGGGRERGVVRGGPAHEPEVGRDVQPRPTVRLGRDRVVPAPGQRTHVLRTGKARFERPSSSVTGLSRVLTLRDPCLISLQGLSKRVDALS